MFIPKCRQIARNKTVPSFEITVVKKLVVHNSSVNRVLNAQIQKQHFMVTQLITLLKCRVGVCLVERPSLCPAASESVLRIVQSQLTGKCSLFVGHGQHKQCWPCPTAFVCLSVYLLYRA